MAQDLLFRNLILGFLAIFGPLAVYFRVRSVTSERLDRWQEGRAILFGLRISAVALHITSIVWLISPQMLARAAYPLPPAIRWSGLALMAVGACLILWAFSHLGANLTDTVVTRRDHTLITSGPYRFIRHPFYAGSLLMVVGFSVVTRNWLIPLLAIVPAGFLFARISIEEQKLTDRFGDSYRTYMRRVPRILPLRRRQPSEF